MLDVELILDLAIKFMIAKYPQGAAPNIGGGQQQGWCSGAIDALEIHPSTEGVSPWRGIKQTLKRRGAKNAAKFVPNARAMQIAIGLWGFSLNLIIAAMLCGMAILIAFTAQVLLWQR